MPDEVVINKAIFWDRDGVLNQALIRDGKPFSPRSRDQFVLIDGVGDVLEMTAGLGFLNIVVTNQPDIGTGHVTWELINDFHQNIMTSLPVERVYVCSHVDEDRCACRKPGNGLLLQAANDYELSLPDCWLVGDRWKDIDAGRSVGCRTIYVDRGYQETRAEGYDFLCRDTSDVVRIFEEVSL